ncbi:unnamed protein product, partial [Coregonus sp. 'balchen']
VKFEDSEMISKSRKASDSRKAVSIHEIAVLARSFLNDNDDEGPCDQANIPAGWQGRPSHRVEGLAQTHRPPSTHYNSYCHLTEGEQEASFAAGVAEQFAIAEAKLKSWASVDDDEEEDDEEFLQNNKTHSTHSSDTAASKHEPRVLFQAETDSFEVLAATACTVIGPHLRTTRPLQRPTEGELVDGEDQPVPLQVCIVHKSDWRPRIRSSRYDSCYSTSLGEEEEDRSVFQEGRERHSCQRSLFSDRGSSGVASFDEEDEKEVEEKEGEEERKREHLN